MQQTSVHGSFHGLGGARISNRDISPISLRFRCPNSDLNCEPKVELPKTSTRGEGGLNLWDLWVRYRCGLTHRFFFLAPEFRAFKRNQRNQKPNHFKGERARALPRGTIYFQAPGGRSKVLSLRSRTGGPGTRIFSRNCEIFFWRRLGKNRREIRGGGGRSDGFLQEVRVP